MAARPKSKVVSSNAGLGSPLRGRAGKPKAGLGTGATAAPTPATPPAQAAVAAAKQAAAAQIMPFWTPQDMMDQANTTGGIMQQLADLDRQLADLKVNTDYGLKQNESNATKGKAAVADDAAGRGIFQSSIKDANMFDVEATRAMNQKYLNDQLATAQLDYETRRRGLNEQLTNFQKAMAAKAAQNASDLSATQSVPDPQAEPSGASTPTSAAGAKPTAKNFMPSFANARQPKQPDFRPTFANVQFPNPAATSFTRNRKAGGFGGYG